MTDKEFPYVIQVRDNGTNAVLAEIRARTASLAMEMMGGYFDRLKADPLAPDVKITNADGGTIHRPVAV